MADTTNGVDPTVELQNGDAPTPAPAVEEQPQLHEETVGLTPAEKFKAEAESTVSGASTPKVNGKKSAGIDLTSDEAFPSLGGPGKAPAAAASWGARSGAVSGSSPAAASNWAPAIVGNTAQLRHELTKENKRDPKDLNPAYLKKGLGAADIVRDIMKKTNTKIESQLFKETGATTYIITGTVQGRDMARRLINKELAAKGKRKLQIPAGVRPFVIGKKGAKIQEIQTKTATKLTLQTQADDQELADDDLIDIDIEGDAEGVQLAIDLIQKIVSERVIKITRKIQCPGQFYPFIAGPFSRNVENWERSVDKVVVPEYYVSNTAPPHCSEPSGPIEVIGEKSAVEKVVEEIEAKVNELKAAQYGFYSVIVGAIKPQIFTRNKGKLIQEILEQTGCSILCPPAGVISEQLYVHGPSEKRREAFEAVYERADRFSVNITDVCKGFPNAPTGPKNHARVVVRQVRGKPAFKAIEQELDVEFVFPSTQDLYNPNKPACNIIIVGKSKESVTQAQKRMIEVLKGYTPEKFAYVDVEPLHHKFVRGSSSKKEAKVGAVHRVEILYPEDPEEPQLVLVYEGTESDVEKISEALEATKAEISSIVGAQVNIVSKTIPVEKELHNKIRGENNTILNALNPSGVAVTFGVPPARPGRTPTAEQTEDSITLRGPPSNVDATLKNIQAFLASTEGEAVAPVVTVPFEYNKQYSGNLIGQKGANINKLRDELGVDVKLNEGQGEIRGVQVCVDAAKRKLFAQLKELEDKATYHVKVPAQYHSVIIGSEGSTVKRLEERYGVRINFPKAGKSEEQASDEIVIRGPKKGADEARQEVTELWKYEADNSHTATISVTARTIGLMFKTGSRDIKALRESSSARILIPQEDKSADPEEKLEIKIRGRKDDVQNAKDVLSKLAKSAENTSSRTIKVDKKFHRSLIGPGGQTLKQIVVSAGGPDDRNALARMVRFPNQGSDSDSITVQGDSEVVAKIIASIEKIVEEKANQTTEILEVAPEKHRKLIGREGSIRRGIESKFSVTIDIPRQRPNQPNTSSEIKITGTIDNVEAAKEHILELVKEQEGETVEVPKHLHHAIAEGNFFKHLQGKYKVSVEHNGLPRPAKPAAPKPNFAKEGLPLITDEEIEEKELWDVVENAPAEGAETYPWVLRGTAENVAKAKVEVEEAIQKAQKESCTGFLVLPDPTKYRFIVGPGGKTVAHIRKETGCRITIPRTQEPGEPIVINGDKVGVEKAKVKMMECLKKQPARDRD